MRKFVALSLFALPITACATRSPEPPVPPQPEPPVAVTTEEEDSTYASGMGPSVEAAPEVPTSGGASMDAAEPVNRGDTIEGWVSKDQPRFYRLQIDQPGELRLSWYTQIMTDRGQGAGANPMLFILDENGGKMVERMEATYATTGTGNYDQEDVSLAVPSVGTVVLQVDCQNCGDQMVHYKLVIP